MQRTTITLEPELLAELDAFAGDRGYANRSEAMRDLLRSGLEEVRLRSHADADCVAAAIYVYDHEARELSRRLTKAGHEHHDLSLATLHVHLDHESCLEINVLRGKVTEVRHFADHVIAERGVRHGRLVMVPVESNVETHSHGQVGSHPHTHLHPGRSRRRS